MTITKAVANALRVWRASIARPASTSWSIDVFAGARQLGGEQTAD
jgi:hypothetical protein